MANKVAQKIVSSYKESNMINATDNGKEFNEEYNE